MINGKEGIEFSETKSSNNSFNKENNITDELNNNSENKIKEYEIKKKYLLGKKRRLIGYRNKLLNKEEIELNINSLYSCTNINPSEIKDNFIGILYNDNNKEENTKGDSFIEINNKDIINYNHFLVYSSKTFQKKFSFLKIVEDKCIYYIKAMLFFIMKTQLRFIIFLIIIQTLIFSKKYFFLKN